MPLIVLSIQDPGGAERAMSAAGAIGATGTADPPGAVGNPNQLRLPISQSNLLAQIGQGSAFTFLLAAGANVSSVSVTDIFSELQDWRREGTFTMS